MYPGGLYHIFNRGNNKEQIFRESRNYDFFLRKFKDYVLPFVDVYSYSLLPNHFHFVIEVKANAIKNTGVKGLQPIEKAFRDFFISYAKSFNTQYKRTGSLFQYKFKRKEITTDAYRTNIIPYVHYNPIAAGLANTYSGWRYSSFRAITLDLPTLVAREKLINWFGGRQRFMETHQWYAKFYHQNANCF